MKLACIVCICLDASGCRQLSALDEFQLLTVMLGQCPGGEPGAFPGITRDRISSSQRALNLPAWHLPACNFLSESSFAFAFCRKQLMEMHLVSSSQLNRTLLPLVCGWGEPHHRSQLHLVKFCNRTQLIV